MRVELGLGYIVLDVFGAYWNPRCGSNPARIYLFGNGIPSVAPRFSSYRGPPLGYRLLAVRVALVRHRP
jgi:hypothetical protein